MKSKTSVRIESNQSFWNWTAKFYTLLQEKRNRDFYGQLAVRIGNLLSPSMKVLELACGTGQITFPLCQKTAFWEATDFSTGMIQAAKKRKDSLPVHFTTADATALPYADVQWDAVIIANALHIMPAPELALSEIRRVLKPGGLLIAPTFLHDGKVNNLQIWLLEQIGFRTFHKWKLSEFQDFVTANGFTIVESEMIQTSLLPECFLVCKPTQTLTTE
jgi:ubiquinone/menaquinone biosynthesis C-methylase UbiE